MIRALKSFSWIVSLAAVCVAQEGLTIRDIDKLSVPAAEAGKIYISACSVVQQEFDSKRPLHPRATLILGSSKNRVDIVGQQIFLRRWNPYLFAQGVVMLATIELMTDRKLEMTKRAMSWADSTVEVQGLKR